MHNRYVLRAGDLSHRMLSWRKFRRQKKPKLINFSRFSFFLADEKSPAGEATISGVQMESIYQLSKGHKSCL